MAITVATRIKAPADRVFAICSDLRNAAGVIRGIERIDILTDGAIGTGTRFRETRVMFGREATEEMEITSFEPDRGYTLEAKCCGSRMISTMTMHPEQGGTRLELSIETRPVSFGARLMVPVMNLLLGGVMRKCVRADLEDVKHAAEGSFSRSPGQGADAMRRRMEA